MSTESDTPPVGQDDQRMPTEQERDTDAITAAQTKYEAWRAERRAKGRDLIQSARRQWAAMEGWDQITSQEAWNDLRARTAEDWESGVALLELLGGRRHIDPARAALLLILWKDFLVRYRPEGPAEYMAVAMGVISFDHFLRVNTLVQNLEARLESEFFGVQPLRSEHEMTSRRAPTRLRAEALAAQLGHDALPWLDRLNRVVLRNLNALRVWRTGPALMVGNVGQLNVGQSQTNQMTPPPPAATHRVADTCRTALTDRERARPPSFIPEPATPRKRGTRHQVTQHQEGA